MKIILLIMISFSLSLTAVRVSTSSAHVVVVDKKTKLIWQDNYEDISVKKDFKGAIKYCKSLRLNGAKDWFLPTHEQLLTITNKKKYDPAIQSEFINVASGNYWSSSPLVADSEFAWYVNFKYGNSFSSTKTVEYYIRCARVGQSDSMTFEKKIQKSLEKKLGNLLTKDMFETQEEFQKRVSSASFINKINTLKIEAIKEVLESTYGKPFLSNLVYDAENAYFVADLEFELKKDFKKQKVAITVPKKIARSFYKARDSLQADAIFEYNSKGVRLKGIKVPYKKKIYVAAFTDKSIELQDTKMAVNFSSFTGMNLAENEVQTFDTSNLKSYNDLDKLLKKAKAVKKSPKKWLLVIGIETYEYTDNIVYAQRSAEMFAKVAQKRLGVKKENSYVLINNGATQAKIKTKIRKMLRRVKQGDTIYFYYNGHGVPVPSLKNAPFMLSSDTEPDYVSSERFFALQNIYNKLSDSKASKIIAIVDSCFSGVTDAKTVIKGVAATKMKAKKVSFNKKKMVVMSAGKATQYSNGYNKKGHRLFSFFVMKNILLGDTQVKTLYKHTKNETYDTSREEYGDVRLQEPTVDGNLRMEI